MQCPRCATVLAPTTAVCVQCGERLPSANAAPFATEKDTLRGLREEEHAKITTTRLGLAPTLEPFDCRPNMVTTLLGMKRAGGPVAPPLSSAATESSKIESATQSEPDVVAPDSPRVSARQEAPPAESRGNTLHGGTPALNLTATPNPAEASNQAMTASVLSKQTVLGVAQPGIAPERSQALRPGRAERRSPGGIEGLGSRGRTSPRRAPTSGQGEENQAPASSRSWVTQVSPPPAKKRPHYRRSLRAEGVHLLATNPRLAALARLHRSAKLLLVSGLGLMSVLGIFGWLWRSPAPPSGRVVLQDDGTFMVEVHCVSCPEGTRARLAGSNTALQPLVDDEVRLETRANFHVGINRFDLEIDRPGLWRDEVTALELPVRYLVHGDLTRITAEHPELGFAVHARPGARVTVDGVPLALDEQGYGRHAVALGERAEGTREAPVLVAERVPYTVVDTDGTSHAGIASVAVTVLPLAIDAPGTDLVTDRSAVLVIGRTVKEATITINGMPMPVDAEGRFRERLELAHLGEQTIRVRADAVNLASRTTTLRITKVRDLAAYAAVYRASATEQYRDLIHAAPGTGGLPVALEGEVVDARLESNATVFLLDVREACDGPPCLVRVVHRSKLEVRAHEAVRVFGKFEATNEGPDLIPEVNAAFVLSAEPPSQGRPATPARKRITR